MFTEVTKQREFHLKLGEQPEKEAAREAERKRCSFPVFGVGPVHLRFRCDTSTEAAGAAHHPPSGVRLFLSRSASPHLIQSHRHVLVLKHHFCVILGVFSSETV